MIDDEAMNYKYVIYKHAKLLLSTSASLPQPPSVNMTLCTTPAALAALKPATTGMRSGRARSPVWPDATVPPTWCCSRDAASNPQPAPDGDPCDPGGRGARLGRVSCSIQIRGAKQPRRAGEDTKGSQVDRLDATRYSGHVTLRGSVLQRRQR